MFSVDGEDKCRLVCGDVVWDFYFFIFSVVEEDIYQKRLCSMAEGRTMGASVFV